MPLHRISQHRGCGATGGRCYGRSPGASGGGTLIPPEFEYRRVTTITEALGILQSRPDARILAGGQSLIPALKSRAIQPGMLVDINGIEELRGVTFADGTVTIGALTTYRTVEDSAELKRLLPILAETAHVVADPPVRNRGTFGGSLAYADPTGDWPAVALALGARLHAHGPAGPRMIAIDHFFLRRLHTALRSDEILTHVTIPTAAGPDGTAYFKLRHPASGYALVGIAAVVRVDENRVCRHCRVAITGAGPRATLAVPTCDALLGRQLNRQAIRAASAEASTDLVLDRDLYASEMYRAHLVRVCTERALQTAAAKIGC